MAKTYTWNCKRSWGHITTFTLFLDGAVNGSIPGSNHWEAKPAIINGCKFLVEKTGFLGQSTYIIDPKDKKAYCEIHYKTQSKYYIQSPAFKYIFHSYSNAIFAEDNKTRIMQLSTDNSRWFFFPKSGKIKVDVENENEELLLFCLFHFFGSPD